MKKLALVLLVMTPLSGCANFGELVQEGIRDAGVTLNAQTNVTARACAVNTTGARICAFDQQGTIKHK